MLQAWFCVFVYVNSVNNKFEPAGATTEPASICFVQFPVHPSNVIVTALFSAITILNLPVLKITPS